MNAKQKAFIAEYMKDKNGTKAAIRAGYSEKSAYSQACDLLKKPEIIGEIEARQNEALAAAGITAQSVLERINRIAKDPDAADKDKLKANELLGKYLGLFTDKVKVEGRVETSIGKLDSLLSQLDK